MKKDKEWLKEELDKLTADFNGRELNRYEMGRLDGYTHASMLLDALDEPKKPVIPQFVADYIEKWKYEGLTMYEWFTFNYNIEDDNKVAKWLYNNDDETNRRREFMLIDAIRYGYEVEKKKLYRVELPMMMWDEVASELKEEMVFLAFDITSGETRLYPTSGVYRDYRTDLTESQIKAIDERYWTFAEEVTE